MSQRKKQQTTERSKNRHLQELRVLIASIAVLFLIVGAVLWILSSQGILQGPLSNILLIIFTVLGVLIGLFQWLFPIDNENTLPPNIPLGAQVVSIIDSHSTATTARPTRIEAPDSDLTQDQSDSKIKYNHIAAPPGNVFDRDEIVAEIERYLSDKDTRGIFLWGGRGCGKSLIAKKIAEKCMAADSELGKRFSHIVWLTFRKEELTTTGIAKPYNYNQSKQEIYAEILQVHGQPYLGNKDPLKGAQEVLRNAPTLVILDSFEFFLEEKEELDSDLRALLGEVAVGSFFFLTSWRNSREIMRYAYRIIEVDPFDITMAKNFFLHRCRQKLIWLPLEQLSEEIHKKIFEATAGIPLALELVGNYVHSIDDVKATLAEINPRKKHYLWEYVYEKALEQLQKDEWRLLAMMILFKSPLDKRRLQEATRFDKQQYERTLAQLQHQGLFKMDYDNIYMHDTLREYIMNRVKNLQLMAEAQQDFIDWAVKIVRANEKWEVDSKQANAFANDLNNLIDALELLLSKLTVEEDMLCFFGTAIAHYLHISGRWLESEKFLKAILGKKIDAQCKIKVQVLLGRHYAHQEEFDTAKTYLDPAMQEAEELGDETLLAEVYLRLGQTYLRRDSAEALKHLEKARTKAAKNSNDDSENYDKLRTRISALCYMAEIQLDSKSTEAALELLEEADQDLSRLQWDRVRAHHTRLRADAYLDIKDKDNARKYYNELKSLPENTADGRLLAWYYLGLAELDRNIEYARKAKKLFETLGLESQVKRAQTLIDKLTNPMCKFFFHL